MKGRQIDMTDKEAIDDIKECYNDGTLEAEITELDEPDDVTEVE